MSLLLRSLLPFHITYPLQRLRGSQPLQASDVSPRSASTCVWLHCEKSVFLQVHVYWARELRVFLFQSPTSDSLRQRCLVIRHHCHMNLYEILSRPVVGVPFEDFIRRPYYLLRLPQLLVSLIDLARYCSQVVPRLPQRSLSAQY